MNGTEQSDSPIVPRKPVNKAAQAVAESAEGSGGTKRNAELQSTVRTQSRDAVSQAQGRIRDAVNRNKKERLTALLHHVDVDCLRRAFFSLKKRAAPGVDGVTWDQYAERLEGNRALQICRACFLSIAQHRQSGRDHRARAADCNATAPGRRCRPRPSRVVSGTE